jgi:hypothetical protein
MAIEQRTMDASTRFFLSRGGSKIMMSKIVFSAVVLLGCLSAKASVVGSKSSDLKFTEERFDIGCVGVDFKIYHNFKLVNSGPNPIHVDSVLGHCDCTEVRFVDSTIAPGDTSDVLIIFNTANFYGPIEKHITVVSKDANVTSLKAFYSANVGQWLMKIEPQPVSVFFLPGQKIRTATISNHALDHISLKNINLHSDIVNITITKGEADKDGQLELQLTPKPGLSAGTYISNYTVELDLHQNTTPLYLTIPVKVVIY